MKHHLEKPIFLIYLLLVGVLSISQSALAEDEFTVKQTTEPRPVSTVMNSDDPYEAYNRKMFAFNMAFNDTFGKPAADAYNSVVPQPARTGISNFFDNLSTPVSAINCFLQGKVEDGLSEIMRFAMNSTFGLLGLIDIAEPAGLPAKNEDLGQTLYHWGVWDQSSYLVLPIIGPYTTRSLFGGVVDTVYDPVYPDLIATETNGRVWIYMGNGFIEYTKVVNLIEDMKSQPDPYVFSRESYLQFRTNEIYDGKAPQPSLDDFNFE